MTPTEQTYEKLPNGEIKQRGPGGTYKILDSKPDKIWVLQNYTKNKEGGIQPIISNTYK